MDSVALLEHGSVVDFCSTAAAVGATPPRRPEDADADLPVGDDMALALPGQVLPAEDGRVSAPAPPRQPSQSTASASWTGQPMRVNSLKRTDLRGAGGRSWEP
ncbi:hypothetical protein ACFY7H_01840 [Streptomyces sp. NPDC012794]|uniref:hypothetical protein n=1 Tax=Streptomyces sp. NPDC012794 TaxID=3364850 RepID=UPI00368C5EB6